MNIEMSKIITRGIVLGACLSCLPASVMALPSFTPLGSFPSYLPHSRALAVSADGQVITGDSRDQVFRWTEHGGMFFLGKLHNFNYSRGLGISDDGLMIVGNTRQISSTSTDYGFHWNIANGLQQAGMHERDTANDVSADGQVVVGGSYSTGQAYRWTATGGMSDLGVLVPGTASHSEALGVSEDGNVVVGVSYSNDWAGGLQTGEAFRWTQAGGMQGLGDFPGGYNISLSQANAVSADGQVVVGRGESSLGWSAFRWTEAGGLVDLGVLTSNESYFSEALGVTADGSTVVGTSGYNSDKAAFIWDSVNGMRNLQTVLENEYGLDLSGWTFTSATGISPDGNVIIGDGINPQARPEAWRVYLDAPAPINTNAAVAALVPGDATQGQDASFIFELLNYGTGTALHPELKVTFPDRATITDIAPDKGQCVTQDYGFKCVFDSMVRREIIMVRVTAAPQSAGTNSVLIEGSAQGIETAPSDNSETYTFDVTGVPEVNITAPAMSSQYVPGELVSFLASASDYEDGDVSGSLQWSSNLDGVIGQGAQFDSSSLSEGYHLVTAIATDSDGNSGSNYVFVRIAPPPNSEPQVTINAPVTGTQFDQTDTINLNAVASDAEDGDLSATIRWTSGAQGYLGTGANLYTRLQPGFHYLQATVTDSAGAETFAATSINIVANNAPVITGFWSVEPVIGETISVFVFGNNFSTTGGTQVFFNGIYQPLVSPVSSEMLIVRVPVEAALFGNISVTTGAGSATSSEAFGTTAADLQVTGIWPTQLQAGVASSVFIFGSGFATDGSTEVYFSGNRQYLMTAVSSEMIIVRVTPDFNLSGEVTVTLPGTGSATSQDYLVVMP